MQLLRSLSLSFLFLLSPIFFFAQTDNVPDATLESPYNTIFVHLHFLQADTYQPEVAALAIPESDSLKAIALAIQLKQILDGRGLYIYLNLLPQQNDFIDSLSQKAYYTPFPQRQPEIYLEKIKDKWYYSKETIQLIPQLHKATYPFGTDLLLNYFLKSGNQKFLGLSVWQYIAILFLIILVWGLHEILSRLLSPIVNRLAKISVSTERLDTSLVLKIARLISLLLLIQVVKILIPVLQLPVFTTELVHLAINIILTVLLVYLALRILDLLMGFAARYAQSTEHKLDEQLLPIVKRMLSILFILGGIIQILRLLDVNVTALIAGLSIGGLALALAAQDTVKNLIGSAMIFIDHPFQIGDYIEGSGFAGTVMEVGFRTTRIRTGDTSIISVPNGTIANIAVTNKGMRVFRLFALKIGIKYDTPPDLIEKYIEGLRQILHHHPDTNEEGQYVHLSEMGDSALKIMFRTFLKVPGYGEELQAKEEILMGILRFSETLGIQLAFPSSSVYVESFNNENGPSTSYATESQNLDSEMERFLSDFKDRTHRT